MRSTKWVSVIAAAALTFGVAACGSDDNDNSSSTGSSTSASSSSGKSGKIALLLPESKTARYESQDRPNFTEEAHRDLPGLRDHLLQRRSGRRQAAAAG